MPFDVNQFRAEMQYDGARPNLFEVYLTVPTFAGVGGGIASVANKLTIHSRAATLPGSTMGVAITNYFGREVKLAGNRSFPNWTITVYNDEDFLIRNSMEKWMNSLNSHAGNLRDPNALNNLQYTVDAEVRQLGKTGDILKRYRFVGLFPTAISDIDLDWGQNDTIEEFGLTFAYQYWETIGDGITT